MQPSSNNKEDRSQMPGQESYQELETHKSQYSRKITTLEENKEIKETK